MALHEAFESQDKKRVKSHFKNLLAVALADGILDKVELDNLFKISKRYYITRDELEELVDNPNQISFNPPSNKEDRNAQLYNLVQMMMVDGEVDSNEFRMCMSFGVGLGFDPVQIEETINKVIELIEKGTQREDAVEEMMKWKS